MTMPSITIRVDFGDAGSGGQGVGISQQGAAPTPMMIGSGAASMSTQGAMSDGGAPTPFANAAAAMSGQEAAPMPMSGMGAMTGAAMGSAAPEPSAELGAMGDAMGGAAMSGAPPQPSADMAAAAHASGAQDAPPHPEGEPAGGTKKPSSKA